MSRTESHLALGRSKKQPASGLDPKLFFGLVGLLMLTNTVTLVGFLMAPDITHLLDDRTERIAAAYEDRITQLRLDVDRLHSRQYAQTGDLNLQMQELVQQQELLAEQHQYVRALADQAEQLGIVTASAPKETGGDILTTGAIRDVSSLPVSDIEAVRESMDAMMQDTRTALATISDATTNSTDAIVNGLARVGLQPQLADIGGREATGGPYIPEDPLGRDSLIGEANDVVAALARFRLARGALETAPVHKPLVGEYRTSSNFGSRTDPFTGKRAFHSGMDFPAKTGTGVVAAGKGRVVFAGRRSGYGNLVEIEHPSGLRTRYGHMSKILVKKGELVDTGTPVGKVGSTGRSTGPHLHFEVRRSGSPLNPADFMATGSKLARFL